MMIDLISCPDAWKVIFLTLGIVFLSIGGLLGLIVLQVHSFLARSSPITADALVVEGWMPDYAIEAAIAEFRQGPYRILVTIGGPVPRGFYLAQYKTFAEMAAATLIELGFDPDQVLAVSIDVTTINRTQNSALELKQWLLQTRPEVGSLNLFTLGTHARRSWLLFKQVFEPNIEVGVIAVKPLHYEPTQWWKSSEGTRTILSEFIAYLYTRFFGMGVG